LDGTAEDYTIAVVGFAFDNDFAELVRINMHTDFFNIRCLDYLSKFVVG
jgi:hypothetical protein